MSDRSNAAGADVEERCPSPVKEAVVASDNQVVFSCQRNQVATVSIASRYGDLLAASICVATKWRKSCKRKCSTPAASRATANRFVTQFGFHGLEASWRWANNGQQPTTRPVSTARPTACS